MKNCITTGFHWESSPQFERCCATVVFRWRSCWRKKGLRVMHLCMACQNLCPTTLMLNTTGKSASELLARHSRLSSTLALQICGCHQRSARLVTLHVVSFSSWVATSSEVFSVWEYTTCTCIGKNQNRSYCWSYWGPHPYALSTFYSNIFLPSAIQHKSTVTWQGAVMNNTEWRKLLQDIQQCTVYWILLFCLS